MENKTGASLKRSYSDFEPFCKWRRDDECEILEIHIKDFRKENLRVQINDGGILTVSGEHPSGGDRWSRFCKEIKVSNDCNLQQIRAKLTGGVLNITMPKKVLPATVNTPSVQDPKPQEHGELRQWKDNSSNKPKGKEEDGNEKNGKRTLWRLKLNKNNSFKFAGLLLVLLVLLVTYGTCIAYRKICN